MTKDEARKLAKIIAEVAIGKKWLSVTDVTHIANLIYDFPHTDKQGEEIKMIEGEKKCTKCGKYVVQDDLLHHKFCRPTPPEPASTDEIAELNSTFDDRIAKYIKEKGLFVRLNRSYAECKKCGTWGLPDFDCVGCLKKQNTDFTQQHDKLREFVDYCMQGFCWDNISEPDGGDLQDKALELGLIELRPIDSELSFDGETEQYFLVWSDYKKRVSETGGG